jgi:hypothetical protein
MEDSVEVIWPRHRILYGIFFIVLGIATAIVTYGHVFPIGSIVLVLSGLIFIFWKWWIRMIYNIVWRDERGNVR